MADSEINSDYRVEMIEELYNRYGRPNSLKAPAARFRYWRKKYAWSFAIGTANFTKRALDISISILMLITMSPLFLIVAIAIKLTDGGPILYWQTRVGKWGKEFPFPKFRSMVLNSDYILESLLNQNQHRDTRTFKMKKDPRITKVGRIIRRFSIDEFPQLLNVLKGDMTLVGPRPPLPHESAQYTLADRRRLDVMPGLTGIWQVSGRGDIPFEGQLQLDNEYIDSQSIKLDIIILLRTIKAVLSGRGAY
ncbi:sugar transferase [Desulfococcaceae bacterium HSG7]|nr:sugar transferase [Desulfococcaceae bacterium HSG9]MDM8554126.1 sugar transferase [Desulfococcaceae bacterium HSG7]